MIAVHRHLGAFRISLERSRNHSQYSSATEAELVSNPWPLGTWPMGLPLRNYLIAWIEIKGQLQGALMVANKVSGDFSAEDGELLSALGHGAAEVMKNQHHRRELGAQLKQLRESDARDEEDSSPGASAESSSAAERQA